MDYIIIETDKPNYHRFYPSVQPDGDNDGIDHTMVWIDDAIRADCTDAELIKLYNSALVHWRDGSPLPMHFGAASVDMVNDNGRFTVAIDAMPACPNPTCPF